jgi:D-sedoheptulose 7-phosphate isomerase
MDLTRDIEETIRALRSVEAQAGAVASACRLVVETLQGGGQVLACGNGGSASEAVHFTSELVGRYRSNRRALPGIALTEPSALTCIGNDFGYDTVFARQVEGIGRPGDLLVVFTSSGNSRNIVLALEAAHARGLRTLALLGKGGGKARGLATVEIIVASERTAAVQEAHLFLLHHICEAIEAAFPGPSAHA